MTKIPMNYRINLANKLRTPTGHLSVTARGSDNEFKNLKNLGAIGDSIQDMQMDYFKSLGLDGTLDDLFGSMIIAELDPNYRVTYTYKEGYTVGDLPNLKNLFDIEVCGMEFGSPVVLSSSRNLRVETRDVVQFGIIDGFPELSLNSFYVKKLNKKQIALYNDIYLQNPVDGTLFGNQVFIGTCSAETQTNYTVAPDQNIDVTIVLKDLENPQFDIDGNLVSFELIDANVIEGITFTNTYRGGSISGGIFTLDAPLDVSAIPLPMIVTGNVTGGTTLNNTFEVPVNPDAFLGIVQRGTDTNPLPEGVSYNLIIPAEVDEGENFTIRLETTGLPEGTEVPYIISGTNLESDDFEIGGLEGVFVIDATGVSELPYRTAEDFRTEGLEVAEVSLIGLPVTGYINIIDTSITPPPSVEVIPVLSPVDESGAIEFDIHIVSYPVGTSFNYTLYGDIDSNDIVGSLTGSITYNGVSPIRVSRQVVEDFTTEGNEIVYLTIEGLELDPKATGQITITDSSQSPTYSLNANVTTVNEESKQIILTLDTTNVPNGSTFNYVVTGIQPEDVTGDPLTGVLTVNNNSGSITFTTVPDSLTEGDETLIFTLTDLSLAASVLITDSSQDLILVDPEIQIRFTAADYTTFVDANTPVITETSLYARNVYQSDSLIQKRTLNGYDCIYTPSIRALYLANTVDGFNLANVTNFQIHIVSKVVDAGTTDQYIKFFEQDIVSPDRFIWRRNDYYYTAFNAAATDFREYGIEVTSILFDYSNGLVRQFRNGVETYSAVLTNPNVYDIVNEFVIGGDSRTGSAGFSTNIFEFEFYTGNDLTYFTNRHNEMVASWPIETVYQFDVETAYVPNSGDSRIIFDESDAGSDWSSAGETYVTLNPDGKSVHITDTGTIFTRDVLNGTNSNKDFQLHFVYSTSDPVISSSKWFFSANQGISNSPSHRFSRGASLYIGGSTKAFNFALAGGSYPVITDSVIVESIVYDSTAGKIYYIQNGTTIGEINFTGESVWYANLAIGGIDGDGIGPSYWELDLYASAMYLNSDGYMDIHNFLKTKYGIV